MFKKIQANKDKKLPESNSYGRLFKSLGSVFLDWLGDILNMWEGLTFTGPEFMPPKKAAPKKKNSAKKEQAPVQNSPNLYTRKDVLKAGGRYAFALLMAGTVGEILTSIGCSHVEQSGPIEESTRSTGLKVGGNVVVWDGATVNEIKNNYLDISFAQDSGFGIKLQQNYERLTVDGETMGNFANEFTVGVSDVYAQWARTLIFRMAKNYTIDEILDYAINLNHPIYSPIATSVKNAANNALRTSLLLDFAITHERYLTYDSFDGTKGDLLVSLDYRDYPRFLNIFDQDLRATNLVLSANGTFSTITNTSGKGTLGALNESGWSVTQVRGEFSALNLGSGRMYYVAEDNTGKQASVDITGIASGTAVPVSSFDQASNIVKDSNVVSYSIAGGVLNFVVNDKGYIAIQRADTDLASINLADDVNFTLSGLNAAQLNSVTILIQDENDNSMRKVGVTPGMKVSDFQENARSLTAGTTVTQGPNAYTADVFLKKQGTFEVANSEPVSINSNGVYKFSLVIPDSMDRSILDNVGFYAYNSDGSFGRLFNGVIKDYIVGDTVSGGKRTLDIEIKNGDLANSAVTDLTSIRLVNASLTTDVDFTITNYQVDAQGSGTYSSYFPFFIDKTKVKKFAVYNSTGTQITGSLSNVSIGTNTFVPTQTPLDWTNITKIMFIVDGADPNSGMNFRLLDPGFTPLEAGKEFREPIRMVGISANSGRMKFKLKDTTDIIFPLQDDRNPLE